MKKTLVALSVLAAATSAQAIEIYNQDGVTVGLHGDIEVVYMNDFQESSMKQEIQDADFGFDVRYAINDEFTFGAYWEFDGSKHTNAEETKNGDTYVAVYSKTYGSIKFGRLCTAVDDLGIGSDYQYGIKTYLDNVTNECADEGVRYDYDNGTFYTTLGFVQDKLSTELDANGNKQDGTETDYMDARVGYRVADFDLSAFYSNTDVDADYQASQPADKRQKDHSGYGAEVRFAGIENVNLAIAYYASKSDFDQDDNNVVAFAADYFMDKWTFSAGYSIGDHDDNVKDQDNWFLNAGYGVAPNTTVYAEIGGEDKDNEPNYDSDVALAIGVKAEF
ncbi:porin [Vibrio panuliri]|uniref:Porin n=1 Tax=Vibrio panuliri TaxID=1381081 RepID=A0ABX3FRW7_9VIBR|nr:porin [Vibrio panuliri]KAB1454764.1 porin [Vibrio panuliri]OLQ96525.1 porin [Vibrio panuliri]